MPDATPVHCRLVFARESLQLLGGQILGGPTTGELANAIGFVIQTQATAVDTALESPDNIAISGMKCR